MHHEKQSVGHVIAIGVLGGLGLVGLESWQLQANTDNWIPVVARLRRTVTELPANGDPTVQEIWDGVYLRDFRGSEIQKLEKIRPRPTQPTHEGIFIDRSGRQGKAYKLAFPTRTALLQHDSVPGRPVPTASRDRLLAAGREEDMVHGIRCFVVPVETHTFGGVDFSGKGCYSPEYDLHLYQELDRTVRESGLTIRTRTEFYDFQVGVAPAADKMRLPPGFVVQENMCPVCPKNP